MRKHLCIELFLNADNSLCIRMDAGCSNIMNNRLLTVSW